MLILGAKSDTGNAIHAIVGPESDLFMDIHGASVIDVTDVVKTLGADGPIHLCLTRCRDEAACMRQLEGKGIPFISTGKVKDQTQTQVPAPEAPVPVVIPAPGPDVDAVLKRVRPARKDQEK